MKQIYTTLTFVIFLLTALIPIPLQASGNSERENKAVKISVTVSILPQKYFVERIGGSKVSVKVLVLPGESPETYEPTPKQISELGKGKLLFTIGVPFEKAFLPKIQNNLPNIMIIDTSKGIKKRNIDGDSSGNKTNPDPHIWMSPVLVKVQAKTILKALVKANPENEEYYTANYNTFIKDLTNLDNELIGILRPFKGSILFVYHPSFGYFADRYGLEQVAIETGGKDPGPQTLAKIIEKVKTAGAKVIFVQPEFRQSSIKTIANATGAAVTAIDPLDEDYLSNMKKIALVLAEAFNQKGRM